MTDTSFAAVVMAGGLGTRMRSATPKHLHPILGRRMVDWVVAAARPLDPDPLVVIASPESRDAFGDAPVAVQERALGTGDAVRSAREAVEGAADLLVLSGDTPLLTTELLRALVEAHRAQGAAATVLSFEPGDARSYGRIVRAADGSVEAIVEAGDATPEQLAHLQALLRIGPKAFNQVWAAREIETTGPYPGVWVRVGFLANPTYNPPVQFAPQKVLPPANGVTLCASPLMGTATYRPAAATSGPIARLASTGGPAAAVGGLMILAAALALAQVRRALP